MEEERTIPPWAADTEAETPPSPPPTDLTTAIYTEPALATQEGCRSKTYQWYLQYIVRKQSEGSIDPPFGGIGDYNSVCKDCDCDYGDGDLDMEGEEGVSDFEAVKELIKAKALNHSRFYRDLLHEKGKDRLELIADGNGTTNVLSSECSSGTVVEMPVAVPARAEDELFEHKQKQQCLSVRSATTNIAPSVRQRRTGVYRMQSSENVFPEKHQFPSVEKFIIQYTELIQQQMEKISTIDLAAKDEKPGSSELLPPPSDYCSSSNNSDDETRNWTWTNKSNDVKRCCSSDSALGLTQSDEEISSSNKNNTEEDLNNFNNDFYNPSSKRGSIDHYNVPSKTLIEAHYVPYPLDRKLSDCDDSLDDTEGGKFSSRRQSCFTDDGEEPTPRYRYWRTPSVVVSDYSDDVIGGLTLEDIEYFRNQRKDLYSSPESSLNSSCSNLNYCGSSVSILDAEYTLRTPSRKTSDCSTCSTVSGDEDVDNHLLPLTASVYGHKVSSSLVYSY